MIIRPWTVVVLGLVALAVPACNCGVPEVAGPPGCADGTREGFLDGDGGVFPRVAACAGPWTGDVADAGALCAAGWHVCRGTEPSFQSISFEAASSFPGCFPFDAANDNNQCHPGCTAAVEAGVDIATGIDLAAVGADCPFRFSEGLSCLASGRVDAAENSGTGCNHADVDTGVLCCAN